MDGIDFGAFDSLKLVTFLLSGLGFFFLEESPCICTVNIFKKL
jgi:hypothetical protein